MKKVMLTVPDELYVVLEGASNESMRPIATEALYRLRVGLGGGVALQDNRLNRPQLYREVGTIQEKNSEKTKDTQEIEDILLNSSRPIPANMKPSFILPVNDYSDVIEWIEKINDPEYQSDSEERSKVGKMVKDAGLSYNARDKKLWKQEGEKWILIKEF
jgi:hypothetical protein